MVAVANNHVVEQRYPERLAGFGHPPCRRDILLARPWVAAWVVVHENDRCGRGRHRRPERFPRMAYARVQRAFEHLFDTCHPVFRVEQQHTKMFLVAHFKLGHDKIRYVLRTPDGRPVSLCRLDQPFAELERCTQLHGFHHSHTVALTQLFDARFGDAS